MRPPDTIIIAGRAYSLGMKGLCLEMTKKRSYLPAMLNWRERQTLVRADLSSCKIVLPKRRCRWSDPSTP